MSFDVRKKATLAKIDKSKKGEIDIQILPLIKKINRSGDYYTTSSCAGRIMLIVPGKRKDMSKWIFVSHEQVKHADLKKHLMQPEKDTMWLRMEPPIIHVCCRSLECAERLIKHANASGFRRSSLITAGKRMIVEIMIPEKMDAPISDKGRMLVDDVYLKFLLQQANMKLKASRKRLEKLSTIF
jgi:tRNA wybutosine-synthesizing protein 3